MLPPRLAAACSLHNCGVAVAILLIAITPVHGSAQDLIPPAPEQVPVQQRLDDLEKLNQEFRAQLNQVQKDNESLTQQLQQMQSNVTEAIKNGPPPMTLRQLEESQPPDVRTDQAFTDSPTREKEIDPFLSALIWSSPDEEWTLQFHNETQLDMRAYAQDHMDPVNQVGFYIARMRMIFNGRLSKPVEYNISLNKGTGSLDLLDAYLNFNYDSRLQARIGRYRMPFTYDFYALSNQFLVSPERSVFALNYGYNRNTGLMVHGEILDDSLEYAIAVANGPRNSYFDQNTAKDIMAFINVRPFENSIDHPELKNLNVGGSIASGDQHQRPQPIEFHTSAAATTSEGTIVGVPSFLTLHDDVIEDGKRLMWEGHVAYYYKQLSLLAAVDGGVNSYGFTSGPGSVPVNVFSWHTQVGYFLTGEEIDRRTFVEVLRPFDLRKGKRGPGAWELQFRFDRFQLGESIFNRGLADASRWTRGVSTTDLGLNWYLNRYLKIDLAWQHSGYDTPVEYAPGRSSRQSDLFWVRFQDNF